MTDQVRQFSLELCCAQCGAPFVSESSKKAGVFAAFDILTCQCSSYPVVAGIPVLQKGPIGAAQQMDVEIRQHITEGRHVEALLAMLVPPPPPDSSLARPWMNRLPGRVRGRVCSYYVRRHALPQWQADARAFLNGPAQQVTAAEFLDFYLHSLHRGQTSYASTFNYMMYRFGMPRHLVAISLASIFQKPGPILELGCGCGHITRTWVERAAGQQVVGIDTCYWALYVARNWIAPGAQYLCCEADRSLPFNDRRFAVVTSSDAFQYFHDKAGSMREFRRVLQPGGAIVLTGLPNAALASDAGTHYRLRPAGYERLVSDIPHCLVADPNILERYVQKQGPPLAHSGEEKALADQLLVSLVASEQEALFQDYGPFDDWPHAAGELRVNPLMVPISRQGHSVRVRRQYPSQKYASQNAELERYLPAEAEINLPQWADLAAGRRTDDMEPLISRCVLLGTPTRFLPASSGEVQSVAAPAEGDQSGVRADFLMRPNVGR